MAYFLFAGDMFVMAFMTAVVVWASVRTNDSKIDAAARIPLEDESRHG
jgi:cbb3-type cytochrome oxidase subunit 3